MNVSQKSQWKLRSDSLKYKPQKGIGALVQSDDDLRANVWAGKHLHIESPSTYIKMAGTFMKTCSALEQCVRY